MSLDTQLAMTKQRVISRDVAGHAVLYPVAQQTFGGPSEAMMNDLEFAEAVALPTQHIGLHFIDRVPPGSLPQAANRFPTSSPDRSWLLL